MGRVNSGGFGAGIERENGCAPTRSGGKGGVRLTAGLGSDGGLGRCGGRRGNGPDISRYPGFWFFFDANQALVRNFPAEMTVLAALLKILLEEDGTAGIGDEDTGGGQKNITSAILHFHTTPEKG